MSELDIDHVLGLRTAVDQRVPASHIDVNGHMNISHYFTECSLAAWEVVSEHVFAGGDYIAERGLSLFTVEHRIAYLGELREGQHYSVHAALVERANRALRAVAFVVDREHGTPACRMEFVFVHIDMAERRAVPFPEDVAARIDEQIAASPWVAETATGLSLR